MLAIICLAKSLAHANIQYMYILGKFWIQSIKYEYVVLRLNMFDHMKQL